MYGLNRLRKKSLLTKGSALAVPLQAELDGLQALRYAFLFMALQKLNEKHTPGPEGHMICPLDVRAKARTYTTVTFSADSKARTLQEKRTSGP